LVAIGVVKAAALDAGRGCEILHGRVVQTLAPEHIERARDHLLLVELTHARHSVSSGFILDKYVKIDNSVKEAFQFVDREDPRCRSCTSRCAPESRKPTGRRFWTAFTAPCAKR